MHSTVHVCDQMAAPAAVKVYGAAMSTCTARVLVCLLEKGVEYELVPVNLFGGEHKHPSFLAKNPFGLIPVLEDGDLTIFESRAIATYIAEKYKDKGTDLLRNGGDTKEAAAVRMWMEVESQQYNPAIQPIIFQYLVMPLQGQSPDQAIIDQSVEKLGAVLDVYEARLATTTGCKYIAGEFFSLADLFHLPYTFYLMKTPWAHLINDRPHVKAWWDDISARPSFLHLAQNLNFGEEEKEEEEEEEETKHVVI